MKTLLAIAGLIATTAAPFAAPSSISFTNSATAGGDNTWVNLALNKFDTGLGTLTGVVVTVNFTTIGGNFTVTTPGDSAVATEVNSAEARVTIRGATNGPSLGFTQLGRTTFAVDTTPTLDPFIVPAPDGSQVFGVTSTNVFVNNAQNISSTFWGAYQSAGGLGSVVFQVRNNPFINISGGAYGLNALAFTASPDMTVTYNYTASTAVPEPGTWAVGALLLSGAAFTMWRRRQSAAVDMAATA